jgi:hypothetical protein
MRWTVSLVVVLGCAALGVGLVSTGPQQNPSPEIQAAPTSHTRVETRRAPSKPVVVPIQLVRPTSPEPTLDPALLAGKDPSDPRAYATDVKVLPNLQGVDRSPPEPTDVEAGVDPVAEGFADLEEMREAVADAFGVDDPARVTLIAEERDGRPGVRVSIRSPEAAESAAP